MKVTEQELHALRPFIEQARQPKPKTASNDGHMTLRVLQAYQRQAENGGKPTRQSVADELHIHRTTVGHHIQKLLEQDCLEKDPRRKTGYLPTGRPYRPQPRAKTANDKETYYRVREIMLRRQLNGQPLDNATCIPLLTGLTGRSEKTIRNILGQLHTNNVIPLQPSTPKPKKEKPTMTPPTTTTKPTPADIPTGTTACKPSTTPAPVSDEAMTYRDNILDTTLRLMNHAWKTRNESERTAAITTLANTFLFNLEPATAKENK